MRHGLAPSATSRVRKVMIMRNPCLAAALEELAKAGIRHPEVITSGKHLQLRWMTATEQPRMLTVPSTPSDWRAPENARNNVRRILRADGMLEIPEPRSPPPRQLSGLELLERRLVEIERRLGIGVSKSA
jgi:hypothetical protein